MVVFGISPDSVSQQAKFRAKEDLPFALLSDEDHAVAEQYGAWIEKSMYGKTFWGIDRTSFLIDADGNIEKIFLKVKPDEHSQQVLQALGVN